ncbi:MAG: hydrogenase maturation nickel metallochaperone HypA [Gammaproteobacteria bacterium]|nr:hydrogenase maturation nickel metallochaperone HypA [Gammaproteobacteria bacterium]
MHELSVCLSLLEQVQAIAAERGAVQVTRIELRVGPLSGVESELLRSAWPMASAGTVAVDAEFIVDEAEIVVHCSACDADTPALANRLVCGECGDFRTTVVSGDEMILQRVELETS